MQSTLIRPLYQKPWNVNWHINWLLRNHWSTMAAGVLSFYAVRHQSCIAKVYCNGLFHWKSFAITKWSAITIELFQHERFVIIIRYLIRYDELFAILTRSFIIIWWLSIITSNRSHSVNSSFICSMPPPAVCRNSLFFLSASANNGST